MKPLDRACDLLDDYVQGSLEPDRQQRFKGHLSNCDDCARAVSNWKTITQALKSSFEPIVLKDPDKILEIRSPEIGKISAHTSPPIPLALAAMLVLAVTTGFTWFVSRPQHVPVETVAGQLQHQDAPSDESTIYADAVFDEETMAIRKCDDPEITVYQVFPKITLNSME